MSAQAAGTANGGPVHVIFDEIVLSAAEAIYFGDKTTDGTWRIIRSGNDLVIQRRVSGNWVTKSTISA